MNNGFIHNWTSPCAVIELLNMMLHAIIEKCHVRPHTHTSNPGKRKKNLEKSRKMATQRIWGWGAWGGRYNRVSVKKCSFTLNIICCVELLNFLVSTKSFFFFPIPLFMVYQDWGVEGVILHTGEMEGTQAKANNMCHTCLNLTFWLISVCWFSRSGPQE